MALSPLLFPGPSSASTKNPKVELCFPFHHAVGEPSCRGDVGVNPCRVAVEHHNVSTRHPDDHVLRPEISKAYDGVRACEVCCVYVSQQCTVKCCACHDTAVVAMYSGPTPEARREKTAQESGFHAGVVVFAEILVLPLSVLFAAARLPPSALERSKYRHELLCNSTSSVSKTFCHV